MAGCEFSNQDIRVTASPGGDDTQWCHAEWTRNDDGAAMSASTGIDRRRAAAVAAGARTTSRFAPVSASGIRNPAAPAARRPTAFSAMGSASSAADPGFFRTRGSEGSSESRLSPLATDRDRDRNHVPGRQLRRSGERAELGHTDLHPDRCPPRPRRPTADRLIRCSPARRRGPGERQSAATECRGPELSCNASVKIVAWSTVCAQIDHRRATQAA